MNARLAEPGQEAQLTGRVRGAVTDDADDADDTDDADDADDAEDDVREEAEVVDEEVEEDDDEEEGRNALDDEDDDEDDNERFASEGVSGTVSAGGTKLAMAEASEKRARRATRGIRSDGNVHRRVAARQRRLKRARQ